MDWLAAINLLAIVVGPIAAVVVTRFMDDRSSEKTRHYQIFRDLMRTRAAKISPPHVDALNLVEIEFHNVPQVKEAWQKYMENLFAATPAESAAQSNFYLRREQLFIKLIQEVAKKIGLKSVDITDVMTNNYYPMGWQNEQQEQEQARKLLIAVMSGSKPLVVKMQDQTQWAGPYPPAITRPSVPSKTNKETSE